MRETPLKPRNNPVHDTLKLLKPGFDDPTLDEFEPTLYRQAMRSDDPAFVAWRPEILHQLALRLERRGDFRMALRRYKLSLEAFSRSESLGLARETRDYAILLCRHGSADAGLEHALEALELHELDRDNAKGDRQRRVTLGYVLRTQILAGDRAPGAVQELTDLALHASSDFCLRDRYFLVKFASKYGDTSARQELRARLIGIELQRGKPLGAARGAAWFVLGKQRSMAGKAIGSLIGRER